MNGMTTFRRFRIVTRRSRPSVVLAVVTGLLAVSALAAAVPAIASATPAPTRTAPRPAGVKLWPWRVSDSAAYTRAVRSGNWVHTPEGLAYKTCVHHVPRGGRVIGDGKFIVSRSGARTRVTPCTRPTLAYPDSVQSRSAQPPVASARANTAVASCQAGAASYWAYTCAVDGASLTTLSERYSIPADPHNTGALIFFWPGFQTSDQTSIVQPVLTWGADAPYNGVKSDNIWYITSWYGDDGTYYTGPSAHVQPNTTVTGTIKRLLCNTPNNGCTWDITTADGSASVGLQWFSGPGMNVIDGGVMEVPFASGCIEVPGTGHEAFRNLAVNDTNGGYSPSFQRYTTSGHCSVNATFSGLNTDITWAPVT
jgi:hypothetical protein